MRPSSSGSGRKACRLLLEVERCGDQREVARGVGQAARNAPSVGSIISASTPTSLANATSSSISARASPARPTACSADTAQNDGATAAVSCSRPRSSGAAAARCPARRAARRWSTTSAARRRTRCGRAGGPTCPARRSRGVGRTRRDAPTSSSRAPTAGSGEPAPPTGPGRPGPVPPGPGGPRSVSACQQLSADAV